MRETYFSQCNKSIVAGQLLNYILSFEHGINFAPTSGCMINHTIRSMDTTIEVFKLQSSLTTEKDNQLYIDKINR